MTVGRARAARLRAGVAGTLLLAPLLAGCGGHHGYCDTVSDHQAEIGSALRNGDRTGALQLLPAFLDLQARAPDDVRDDYQLLVTRITALRDALDDAGVDASSYDPRHPPAGITQAERSRIREAAAQLAAPDAVQALSSVQQEVLDVCHIPLEL
jgi:hypothetical protein